MGSLYAGNLHPECTEATLHQKFAPLGNLLNVHICRDNNTGQPLGYGFLNFESKADAEKALSLLNYDLVKGRAIRLIWATKNAKKANLLANLFLKSIDPNIDEKTLYGIFAPYGVILSLKVERDEFGQSRGYGFVQFEKEDEANEAMLNLNAKVIRGKAMLVSKFIPRVNKYDNFKNVYIKNFELTWKDEDLKKLCQTFGTILSSKVMTDEKGESRGFGFVCFEDADSAKKAVKELNGAYLYGHKLYVGRAKKIAERRAEVIQNLRRKLQRAHP